MKGNQSKRQSETRTDYDERAQVQRKVQRQVRNPPLLWLLVLHVWGGFKIRESWRRNTRATGGELQNGKSGFVQHGAPPYWISEQRCKHNCHIKFVIVWEDQTRRGTAAVNCWYGPNKQRPKLFKWQTATQREKVSNINNMQDWCVFPPPAILNLKEGMTDFCPDS